MAPITVALAGDTMLGRGVAERLGEAPGAATLWSDEIRAVAAGADLFVLNLECCVSDRGEPWPAPGKPFFFRAPPAAAGVLAELGVDCVTVANNHALDFGFDALADTRALLERAGVRAVGAGHDVAAAREFAVLEAGGTRLAVVGVTDHPDDFAAAAGRPGVALADLRHGVPGWLADLVARAAAEADAVLVTPHWGPNMTPGPPRYVRDAAAALLEAGATLVAGHSAHVFHGVADRVVHDMGDFVDDYAIDAVLRNDLGLLFLVTLDGPAPSRVRPVRLEAVPLFLDYCHTTTAHGAHWEWIRDRFSRACAAFGTTVTVEGERLVTEWA
ncbi:CapA family protein [Streptomyces griseocarneus]|uniref:CapA family protein n=1 Tax=Streptomyces griseocarneus TaxID=51201 RepID=UPI00167D1E9E|nr:CapA family protein [Streptomyces griseocarneus]MBZ6474131.1 CapA family protein [Streptomyces griseocarneus]GHG52258.1 capsule biosynthesis protein [Streptomyces griseocarneus]